MPIARIKAKRTGVARREKVRDIAEVLSEFTQQAT
jgi:hypothetical protein